MTFNAKYYDEVYSNTIRRSLELALSYRGKNQKILAKGLCVSENTVSSWMRGDSVPSSKKLCIIGQFLELSIEYFQNPDMPIEHADLKLRSHTRNEKKEMLKEIYFTDHKGYSDTLKHIADIAIEATEEDLKTLMKLADVALKKEK